MSIGRISVALFSACILFTATAQATPITYLLSGNGSGDVDGTAFSDQPFTFTFFGDTANVVNAGVYMNDVETAPATLQINGFALATLTGGVLVFDNTGNAVAGIERDGPSLDIFDLQASAFSTYDLTTALGPISTSLFMFSSQGSFPTSLGPVTFTNYSGSSSFEAQTAAVPEPTALLLLGTGLVALARRRFTSRA